MSDFNLMSFLIDKEERKSKQEDIMDPGSIWDYGSGGAGMVGDDFLNFDNFLKMDDEVVNFDLLGDPCSGGGLFDHRAPLVDDSVCSDSGVSSTLSPPHGLSEEELSIKCTPTPSELNYAATTPTQSIFSEDIDMSDTSSMDILISMDPADSDSSHPTPPTAGQTSTVPASAGKKTTAPGSASHSTASTGQAPVKKPAGSGKGKTSMGKKKSVPACAASSQSQQQAPPSILIPVNLPGLKTIKVVNASGKPLSSETLGEISSKTGLAGPQLKLISSGFQPLSPGQTVCNMLGSISNGLASLGSPAQSNSTSCTDDEDFDEEEDRVVMEEGEDGDSIYPRLELTYEERRLMEKEGVQLPSHYPLTKLEERELKRIRRKIRNKISAQDSRKRKKEYVDGLEERVKKCTEDNVTLLKRIKQLEARNHTLCSQLRKIQTLLTNKSKLKSRLSTAHPGAPSKTTPGGGAPGLLTSTQVQSSTCLMVLCLSLALILAPNLQTGGGALSPDTLGEAPSEGSLEKTVQHATSGRSRSLLFTKYALGGPQHSPAPAHPLTAELVEEAYAQLLAGGVRGAPPAPDEPRGAPPRGDAGGLGGLLADLGELLSFKSAPVQVKEEEEEREVIEIKEEAEDYDAEVCEVKQELGGGGGCGEKKAEPDLQILYNDHNYGKPVVRKRSAAFLDDYARQGGGYKKHPEYIPAEKKPSLDQGYKKYPEYIPAEKKASLELEPLISLLAAARESLGKAAQGPRILDSPVDDFVPKSLRSASVNLVSSTSAELGNARQGSFNRSSRRLVEREENYIEVE